MPGSLSGRMSLLALLASSSQAEDSKPVISLDLESMGANLVKVHANKESLCHTKGEWETLLKGGTPGFKIPGCLHDGSGVNLVHAVRCDVKTDREKTCPEPDVKVWDHHEGDLAHKLSRNYTLCIESDAGVEKPKVVNRNVDGIDYDQRGEYLITYGATDSSGNSAEEVQFAMIFEDHVFPTFNGAKLVYPRQLESMFEWNTHTTISPDHKVKGQVTDNYDGDVSHTISFVGADNIDIEKKLGKHTFKAIAHDFANIFGLKNVDNTVSTSLTVTIEDTTPPSVICQEGTDKPVTCTTEGCKNACPCGKCKPIEVDCLKLDAGKFDVEALGYCVDYHDSWTGSAVDTLAVRPSVTRILGYSGYHTLDAGAEKNRNGHFADHHANAVVQYTCVDSNQNKEVKTRAIKRIDYTAPKLVIGESKLSLACGTPDTRRTVDDLLTHFKIEGRGYTVSDQCDDAVVCKLSLFKGDCGGKFSCRAKNGKWTTCNGGNSKPLVSYEHQLYDGDAIPGAISNRFMAAFTDGKRLGVYALKYECSDDHENAVAKCRTIESLDSQTCNPDCEPDEYRLKKAVKGMPRTCKVRSDGGYCCPVTTCTHQEFEVAPPSMFTDRRCQKCTVCAFEKEYQVKDCTKGSDRLCAPFKVPECDYPRYYEAASMTPFQDRKCLRVNECAEGMCEVARPTPFSDRVCEKCKPIDCVPSWSDFATCERSLGLGKKSKVRVYSEPKYGGKPCKKDDTFQSSIREKIVVSSSDMTKADADRISKSVAERAHMEKTLRSKLSLRSPGKLTKVEVIAAKYYDFDGDSGVDIIYEILAEFYENKHCHELSIEVLMGMNIDAIPADYASKQAETFCRYFVANQLNKDPSDVEIELTRGDRSGKRKGRTSVRRLTATGPGVNLVFKTSLSSTEMKKCTRKKETRQRMEKFLADWKIYHPNNPPADQLARMEKTLSSVSIAPPQVDLLPANEDTEDAVMELQRDESTEIKCPVDCEMTKFENKTVCGNCGGGWVNAKRVITVHPLHGGDECGELKVVTVCDAANAKNPICAKCNTKACPSPKCDAVWGEWSACSKTCGGGMQCRSASNAFALPRGCPASQCRSCNKVSCGPEACDAQPLIPKTCTEEPFCCDDKETGLCYAAPRCSGRSDVGGIAGTYCRPDWYRVCRNLARINKPCLYEETKGSAFEDRVCSPVEVKCPMGIIKAPTKFTNSVCRKPTTCRFHQYAKSKPIIPLVDRTCGDLTVTCKTFEGKHSIDLDSKDCNGKAPFCEGASEYIAKAPSKVSDVQCRKLETCSSAFCKSGASGASDRVCLTLGLDFVTEAEYLADEAEILKKISAATQGIPIENIVTSTAALEPIARPLSTEGHVQHAHRLVVNLAVKVSGGTFEEMVLQKKNPSAAAAATFESDDWHTRLCVSMRHNVQHLKGFKCKEHLHVYSVNCKAIRSPPALGINGEDTIFLEVGSPAYTDAGAHCTDSVDGGIRVRESGAKHVNTKVLGKYEIDYTCTNSAGIESTTQRVVVVHHKKCPACVLKGEPEEVVEASFPFEDHAKVTCADFFATSKSVVGTVDVETVGSYILTYVATDSKGLTNMDCGGAVPLTRTVTVVDTLKPVLGLSYKTNKWFSSTQSGKPEVSPLTGRKNPIYESVVKKSLMAETTTQPQLLMSGTAIFAAAGLAVGAAFLARSNKASGADLVV